MEQGSVNSEKARWQILHELRRREGDFISGEELSHTLGLTRSAVWKHVQALRREGYLIEACTRRGYRLLFVPDRLYPEEVLQDLKTSWLGRPFYYYEEIDSTNRVAKDLAEEGAPEGTAVVAEAQTAGRGRLGRSWLSPAGKGIYLSLVFRPGVAPWQIPQLSLLAAVGAVEAVREVTGLKAGIKWPNDLLVGGRKLGGILTEMRAEMEKTQYVVLGLGLNVNLDASDLSPELETKATSIKLELGKELRRAPLLKALLYHLEKWYELWLQEGFVPVRGAWKEASVTLERRVTVQAGKETCEGWAVDIDEEGRLVVRDDDGRLRFFTYGEVTVTGTVT